MADHMGRKQFVCCLVKCLKDLRDQQSVICDDSTKITEELLEKAGLVFGGVGKLHSGKPFRTGKCTQRASPDLKSAAVSSFSRMLSDYWLNIGHGNVPCQPNSSSNQQTVKGLKHLHTRLHK